MAIRSLTRAGLLAVTALLAGCAVGGPDDVQVGTVQKTGYEPAMRNYVAERGGMALEVIGDPFPGARTRFADTAARTITESHFGPEFALFADPAEAPEGSFRTVIVANPGKTVTPANACQTEVSDSESAREGTLQVIAAFCRGDKAVTRITGQAHGVSGPDDPKVVQLFRQIGLNLYPSRSDQTDKSQGDVWP